MAKLIVITNTIGSFGTNCYSIVNQETREALLVDPAENASFLINMYKQQEYKCVGILLTHGHLDHMGAVKELREQWQQVEVIAGIDEKAVLNDAKLNLSGMFGSPMTLEADKYVSDNDELKLLDVTIKCIHVPGHTQGGTCYYFADNNMLFSGDTLFAESIGRSDFPTGNGRKLIEAIENKLFTLPEEVEVYPGHMGRTTIKREKNTNPFF